MAKNEKSNGNNDVLEIPCPKCGQKHRYLLDVKRSYIFYKVSPTKATRPVQKTFTRIFTCPTNDQEVQVTFSLTQNFGTLIYSIAVKGVEDESREETNLKKE